MFRKLDVTSVALGANIAVTITTLHTVLIGFLVTILVYSSTVADVLV